MATYLLKKSYRSKDLKQISFKDLWNSNGIFTTMWIFDKPPKILFFNDHIDNLIKSLKIYNLYKKNTKNIILKYIKLNIKKNFKYNHLLRVALNNKNISISLRKRLTPRLNFNLKLVNYKRYRPEFKNLKYKKILNYLSKMNTSKADIALCVNKQILESGTSNILFVKNNQIYSPRNKFYKGITFKFFEKKVKKIIKKDIYIDYLKNFDEIILIGSGKGVVSVNNIDKPKWRRKSLKTYRLLSNIYFQAVTKCPRYNG